MLDFDNLSELDKAKYLLPLQLLQLPSIFESYAKRRGLEHFYQILPIPEDNFESEIKSFGIGKAAPFNRSLKAIGIPLDEGLSIPVGLDLESELKRLRPIQNKFLKDIFQPQIFASITKIENLASELDGNLEMFVNAPGAKAEQVDTRRKNLLAYWGWDGQPPRTMDEVGELALSGKPVSRQRIKQVELEAKLRLEAFLPYTEQLQKTITTLKYLAPIHVKDVSVALVNEGVVLAPIRLHGLLSASAILLGDTTLTVDKSLGIIFPNDDTEWFYELLKSIGSMVESNGVCQLESLPNYIRLTPKRAKFIKLFLDRSGNYSWIDDDQEWVFTNRKRNRVENTLQKIFSVTDSIPIDVCVEQVNKDPRIEIDLTTNILINLISHFDFVEHLNSSLRRTYVINVPFGGAERAFLTQMTTRAEDFDVSRIEAYAEAMATPVISPIQVLYRSPITRSIGYNKWVLIGNKWIDIGETKIGDHDLPSRQEAVDGCLDQMWSNALTAKGQSGKTIQSIRKSKLIEFTKEEFKTYCRELMLAQKYLCKLTSLPLDIYLNNRDYMPSADRIDSDKCYEKGNIQITCSFANIWKSNQDNDKFLSLLANVRKVEY